MAIPYLIIRFTVGLAVRYGSRYAQSQLVKRGALQAVRGDIFSLSLFKGSVPSRTILNSLLTRRPDEVLKGVFANQVADEISDLISSGIVKRRIANADRLAAEHAAVLAAQRDAAEAAARVYAERFAARVEEISPESSGAYLRNWQQAFSAAGLQRRRRTVELRVTQFNRDQQDKMRRNAEFYRLRGTEQWGYRRSRAAAADLARADELSARATLLDDPEAVIDGVDDIGPVVKLRYDPPGEGRVVRSNEAVYYDFINRARHAQAVEAREFIVRRAVEYARGGSLQASDAFVGRVNAARAGVGARVGG